MFGADVIDNSLFFDATDRAFLNTIRFENILSNKNKPEDKGQDPLVDKDEGNEWYFKWINGQGKKKSFVEEEKIINSPQNIEVGGTSVGVPTASTGPSVAALAGAGTVSEAAKSMEDAGVAQSAEERFANAVAEISESLVPKWLVVEVIGFVEEDENEQEE